ncbi:MAG TPA: MOSC domain-containing protein [Candidatus Cybelea sp.]|nr:MOSC domain-containing protein [Candidatus Cybelea sp.]
MKRPPMFVGRLDAVRRYPVKSLRGESLDGADIGWSGIPGDRASAFFVRDGNARVGKTYRGKEHDRLHLIADARAARRAAGERGVEVELRAGDHFFDAAPVSIVIDRWLEGLSDEVGYAVEWERFRPNFFVRAAADFAATESDLVAADLRMGTVRLRVRSPIERCVTITYHPRGEKSDPRILRFLAEQRNAWMGIYCDVLEPGRTHVGDSLVREAPLHA